MQEERNLPIHLSLLFIVLLFTGVILYARHVTDTRADNQITQTSPTKLTTYVYGVNLEYPADWQPTPGYNYERYNSDQGFFQLGTAGDSKTDIDTLVRSEVSQASKPFGISPTTETLTVDNEPARLITPSHDQDPSFQKQAELIVKYPKPVTVSSQAFYYLILQADTDHIQAIIQSLTFL